MASKNYFLVWYASLALLIYFATVSHLIGASEEYADSMHMHESFQAQLQEVITCFERVADNRQLEYLSSILCHRYLVCMSFVSAFEVKGMFSRFKQRVIELGEMNARLNRASIEALQAFDDLSEMLPACSYVALLPAMARRLGLYELIEELVTDFKRFAVDDIAYLQSITKDTKRSGPGLLDKALEANKQSAHTYAKRLSIDLLLTNNPKEILDKMKECADLTHSIADSHKRSAPVKLYRMYCEGTKQRCTQFIKKVEEVMRIINSYGENNGYRNFQGKIAREFFSSMGQAQLYLSFHTYLCRKIGITPKPIFGLHMLAIKAAHNNGEKKAFWHAFKHSIVHGDGLWYAHELKKCWQRGIGDRLKKLSEGIEKLNDRLAQSKDHDQQKRLEAVRDEYLKRKAKMEDLHRFERFALTSSVGKLDTCRYPSESAFDNYKIALDSYCAYVQGYDAANAAQELFGQAGCADDEFFTRSETVADFCTNALNEFSSVELVEPCLIANYFLFFAFTYFGKVIYIQRKPINVVFKTLIQNYCKDIPGEDFSRCYQEGSVSDWDPPQYDIQMAQFIKASMEAVCRRVQDECSASGENSKHHSRDTLADADGGPGEYASAESDDGQKSVLRREVAPTSGERLGLRTGKKMAWQELLLVLEKIDQCFIPRTNVQSWSAEAGYAHCWRSQKSSLCVTYFFFKEARQQKRDISLVMSRLSKQIDRPDTGWDFYHAFPVELDHTLLNEYSMRIDQNHELWSQLGLKRDVRNCYAYIVRAKIVPGYTDPIRLQDPDFKHNDFGHTGYFVWACRGNDICYHRQFHALRN